MARSIHDTWGVLQRVNQADWSDPDVPRAIKAEMRKNLRRQHVLRQNERRRRRGGAAPPPPLDLERLPIIVEDSAPYAFYPASEEDIRAVLARLAPGSLDGLQAIRLCVDKREGKAAWPRDPFTGRRRFEVIRGVYTSPVLGTYNRATATIRLHAYLCDPGAVGPFLPYFKMVALSTLVHEAAHHFDRTFRVARSRWNIGDQEKHEDYAYGREDKLTKKIVSRYVLQRYASECAELERWVEEHGGTALGPPGFLVIGSTSLLKRAFLALVRSVLAGDERDASRVVFARELHRVGGNKPAGEIVRAVLANRPDDAGALAVSACIAQCEGRDFELAESLCRRAIASDPSCPEARIALARGYAIQERWDRAATACEEGLSVLVAGDVEHGEYLLETLVESHLVLGAFDAVRSDLARMRAWGSEDAALGAEVYDVIARCWAEQWEEALLLATRMLKTGKYDEWDMWLAAVRFECAQRLHRPHLAGSYGEADLARLAKRSFTRAWSQRIRAIMP
jgi:hypothetical protein